MGRARNLADLGDRRPAALEWVEAFDVRDCPTAAGADEDFRRRLEELLVE